MSWDKLSGRAILSDGHTNICKECIDKGKDARTMDILNKGISDARKELLDRIEKDIVDLIENRSNPCMKCGSVRCAICSQDIIENILKKLRGKNDKTNN